MSLMNIFLLLGGNAHSNEEAYRVLRGVVLLVILAVAPGELLPV